MPAPRCAAPTPCNWTTTLEVLARKPGALPCATALAQARGSGAFTTTHEAWWCAARAAHGDAGGTRSMIEVLLLHRHLRSRRTGWGQNKPSPWGQFKLTFPYERND